MGSKAWHTDRCWFAGSGPCGGPLQRAHWIKQQAIVREVFRRDRYPTTPTQDQFSVVWDPAVWTPMCERHHRRFDARLETVPRGDLPPELVAYANRHGILWMIEREFS